MPQVFNIIYTRAVRNLSNIVRIKLNVHESKSVIYQLPIFVKSNVIYKIELSNFFMNVAALVFSSKRGLVKDTGTPAFGKVKKDPHLKSVNKDIYFLLKL